MSNQDRIRSGQLEDYEDYPEDDLDVEFVDLDTLNNDVDQFEAESILPPWSADRVLDWQRSFRRKQWRVGSVIGSLVLILLIVLVNLHTTLALLASARTIIASHLIKKPPILQERFPTPKNIRPSLVIAPSQDGLTCVVHETWSPDSRSIALLGYTKGCVIGRASTPGLATIHDASTGRLLAQIQPDSLIWQTIHTQFPTVQETSAIFYETALWSPDGRRLALIFAVGSDMSNTAGASSVVGVVFFDVVSRHTQVLLQKQSQASPYVEWDTITGKTFSVPPSSSTNRGPFNASFPIAVSYTWGENGKLIPQKQAGIHPPLIGNPDGNASFSAWQPGVARLIQESGFNGTVTSPPIAMWYTRFTAWSPDGRYLVDGAYTRARLEPRGYPIPDHKTLVSLQLDDVPVLPIRDEALKSILDLLEGGDGDYSYMMVAWRPDGRLLGATRYEDDGSISLYASNTGYKVATLHAPMVASFNHSYYYSAFSSPTWSPDGTHLLMQNPITNLIVLWNVAGKL